MTPSPAEAAAAPRALLAGADPDTFDLLSTWLAEHGWQVGDAADGGAANVLLVDLPYPRDCGPEHVREIAAAHPATPIIVLSATLFGSVECSGPCAKSLGVAGVLPKPVPRDLLVSTVQRLARRG